MNYTNLKVTELKNIIRERGIRGFSRLRKAGLITLLENDDINNNQINNSIDKFLNNQDENEISLTLTNEVTGLDVINNSIESFRSYIFNNDDYYLLIEVNDVYYTINQNTIDQLATYISQNNIIQNNPLGSDEELFYQLQGITEFKITKMKYERKRQNGAFFPFINISDIDLSKYSIYKEINQDNYNDNCLIKCFKNSNISEYKYELLKTIVFEREIPKSCMNDISKILKVNIVLNCKSGKTEKKLYFPKIKKNLIKYDEKIELGLLEGHYFLNELTNYSPKDLNINKSNIKISSYKMIKLMLENKDNFFKNITYDNNLCKTQFYTKSDNITTLEYDFSNCKKIEYKQKVINEDYIKIFFDFETYVDNKTKIHKPYLCSFIDENNRKRTFYNENCGKRMLDFINKNYNENIMLIAHNSSYDINFILKYTTNVKNIIKKGSKVLTCECMFFDTKITIKDSLSLIPMSLKKFGKCFNLNQGKEVISYQSYNDYYNKDGVSGLYPIKKILDEFKDDKDKQKTFLNNIKKWKLQKDNDFRLIQYSAMYCMIDCEVLKNGYDTFRKWIIEICNIDIDTQLTLAGLADNYFIKEDCFKGCYSFSGVLREFIQRSIVGGRTMSNNNEKYHIKNKNISDFDAVSLYPSAMYRMDGYLKGTPKILKEKQLNYDFIKKQDGYFVEILVKKINIKRGFSLLSKINENGVRIFNNDYKNEKFIVDKITLEDFITFQNIEFEIIRGYYFNSGRNIKIKETIFKIFNERLKMKKEKNPAQLVYKLLMNSAYGKTILKPIEEEIKIFNGEEKTLKFVSFNNNHIKKFYKIIDSDFFVIHKKKPVIEHFSRPHIGTEILSMSKRIMNEVLCTAEDNDLMVWYQDTDSMHLKTEDIEKLQKIYNKKYNRELIGKNLGQFHSDFELEGATKNIVSKELIILGKKCYLDKLVGENENNEKINGYHLRMKGIPNSTLFFKCEELGCNPVDMYKKLFEGEQLSFDLLESGKRNQFKFNKNFTVNNEISFFRTLKF